MTKKRGGIILQKKKTLPPIPSITFRQFCLPVPSRLLYHNRRPPGIPGRCRREDRRGARACSNNGAPATLAVALRLEIIVPTQQLLRRVHEKSSNMTDNGSGRVVIARRERGRRNRRNVIRGRDSLQNYLTSFSSYYQIDIHWF